MKIVTWNVNGIRAAWSHGLARFLHDEKAEIYCLQETKVAEPVSYIELDGYYAFWSFCSRPGYSGTLCLTRWQPIAVSYDFSVPVPGKNTTDPQDLAHERTETDQQELVIDTDSLFHPTFDCEGRIITLEFEQFYLVNVYVPNPLRHKSRSDYRAEWDVELAEYLRQLHGKKMTIVCGDFNMTSSDLDVYEENQKAAAARIGFESLERDHFHALLKDGFVDTWRQLHPEERAYSWWSNRLNKRKQNRGWRIDYMLLTRRDLAALENVELLGDVRGSDHCPQRMTIDVRMEEPTAPKRRAASVTDIQSTSLYIQRQLNTSARNTDLTALWENIDWEQAEQHVAFMQKKLALAASRKDRKEITYWQIRIVRSIDSKLLAVRHVCSAAGGSGVDGVIWMTGHDKMAAALSLNSAGYHAEPARLLLVKSKTGRQRRIHISSYYDRAMQSLYALSLDPVAESWGDRKSFAFRKGRSALDMNEYIRLAFSETDYNGQYSPSAGGKNPPEWAFVTDVRQCYEHISHEWILENIPMDHKVLLEFLKAGYMFAGEMFPVDVGIGIGLALSPIIANMALDGLQWAIYNALYRDGTPIDYPNGNLLRYADDIVVTARSEAEALRIGEIIREFLRPRGLELSEKKSRVVNINDGFDLMGRTYIKYEGHVYVYPSDVALNRFKHSLKETVEGHTGAQQSLIVKLNRKLDGWATYHKTEDAIDAFRSIDVYLKALLLELCERKHPKWPRAKILEKYWYIDASGRYVYALPDKKEESVKFISDTLLIHHPRVKTIMNPYIDIEYLERRVEERAARSATGIYRSIWNRQDGRCYYCGRRILQDQEKCVLEVNAGQAKKALRMAYVHTRCLRGSIEYVDTDTLPETALDTMELLDHLRRDTVQQGQKFLRLAEFFCSCPRGQVTLSFDEIEEILGWQLGKSKYDKSYWSRTGFMNISQSWLDNGYEIVRLNLDKGRITFRQTRKETQGLNIPDVLMNHRIPTEAKYELENYFSYIIKKYGL